MNYEEQRQRKIELMKKNNFEYILVQKEITNALCKLSKKSRENNIKEDNEEER